MRVIAMLLVVLMAGCGSLLEHHTRDVQGPPAFKEGYRDGCSSGLSAGGYGQVSFKKDVERFNTDKLYRQGWDDGYSVCRTRAIS